MSRKTVVLVTDGADPYTRKAEAACQFNTRIVTPDVFAELVHYIQPAEAETRKLTHTATIPVPTQPRPMDRAAVSALPIPGPAIRAWARNQGLPVGVRGRLSAEILAAYATAHGLETTTIDG